MIIIPRQKKYWTIFIRKLLLRNQHWKRNSNFGALLLNKKYLSVIPTDIYSEKDIKLLKKEIELVAGFKLDDCAKEYIIRQGM